MRLAATVAKPEARTECNSDNERDLRYGLSRNGGIPAPRKMLAAAFMLSTKDVPRMNIRAYL